MEWPYCGEGYLRISLTVAESLFEFGSYPGALAKPRYREAEMIEQCAMLLDLHPLVRSGEFLLLYVF